jgi:hypothetical protein
MWYFGIVSLKKRGLLTRMQKLTMDIGRLDIWYKGDGLDM